MRNQEVIAALVDAIEVLGDRRSILSVRLEAIKSKLEGSPVIDLVQHLDDARLFSLRTFGPGPRPDAVIAHIRKELDEISKQPHDLMEWIDVVTLGFDGAMRMGFSPQQCAEALVQKLVINQGRKWPDWRKIPLGQPIEHIREDPPKTAPARRVAKKKARKRKKVGR